MLDYWIEKYGVEEAFESYATPVMKADPVAWAAFMQLKVAKLALAARIKELDQEGSDA